MKCRPILFNDEMVRAILDDRKTMTRRVIKLNLSGRVQCRKKQWHIQDANAILGCPNGQIGDRLWVRETWQGTPECISYKASDPRQVIEFNYAPWRPSIHMPRWASRITLEITNIRVERLQEITEEDAIAEGIQRADCDGMKSWPWLGADHPVKKTPKVFTFAKQAFSSLWDSINGKQCPWTSNPWVWVIEFKRI